jgi:hypothetical protein
VTDRETFDDTEVYDIGDYRYIIAICENKCYVAIIVDTTPKMRMDLCTMCPSWRNIRCSSGHERMTCYGAKTLTKV